MAFTSVVRRARGGARCAGASHVPTHHAPSVGGDAGDEDAITLETRAYEVTETRVRNALLTRTRTCDVDDDVTSPTSRCHDADDAWGCVPHAPRNGVDKRARWDDACAPAQGAAPPLAPLTQQEWEWLFSTRHPQRRTTMFEHAVAHVDAPINTVLVEALLRTPAFPPRVLLHTVPTSVCGGKHAVALAHIALAAPPSTCALARSVLDAWDGLREGDGVATWGTAVRMAVVNVTHGLPASASAPTHTWHVIGSGWHTLSVRRACWQVDVCMAAAIADMGSVIDAVLSAPSDAMEALARGANRTLVTLPLARPSTAAVPVRAGGAAGGAARGGRGRSTRGRATRCNNNNKERGTRVSPPPPPSHQTLEGPAAGAAWDEAAPTHVHALAAALAVDAPDAMSALAHHVLAAANAAAAPAPSPVQSCDALPGAAAVAALLALPPDAAGVPRHAEAPVTAAPHVWLTTLLARAALAFAPACTRVLLAELHALPNAAAATAAAAAVLPLVLKHGMAHIERHAAAPPHHRVCSSRNGGACGGAAALSVPCASPLRVTQTLAEVARGAGVCLVSDALVFTSMFLHPLDALLAAARSPRLPDATPRGATVQAACARPSIVRAVPRAVWYRPAPAAAPACAGQGAPLDVVRRDADMATVTLTPVSRACSSVSPVAPSRGRDTDEDTSAVSSDSDDMSVVCRELLGWGGHTPALLCTPPRARAPATMHAHGSPTQALAAALVTKAALHSVGRTAATTMTTQLYNEALGVAPPTRASKRRRATGYGAPDADALPATTRALEDADEPRLGERPPLLGVPAARAPSHAGHRSLMVTMGEAEAAAAAAVAYTPLLDLLAEHATCWTVPASVLRAVTEAFWRAVWEETAEAREAHPPTLGDTAAATPARWLLLRGIAATLSSALMLGELRVPDGVLAAAVAWAGTPSALSYLRMDALDTRMWGVGITPVDVQQWATARFMLRILPCARSAATAAMPSVRVALPCTATASPFSIDAEVSPPCVHLPRARRSASLSSVATDVTDASAPTAPSRAEAAPLRPHHGINRLAMDVTLDTVGAAHMQAGCTGRGEDAAAALWGSVPSPKWAPSAFAVSPLPPADDAMSPRFLRECGAPLLTPPLVAAEVEHAKTAVWTPLARPRTNSWAMQPLTLGEVS